MPIITGILFLAYIGYSSASLDSHTLWKNELGSSTWKLLHNVAAKYSDNPSLEESNAVLGLINSLPLLYPCEICRINLVRHLAEVSPLEDSISDRTSLSKWICGLHNIVNRELGKEEIECEMAVLDKMYSEDCGGCAVGNREKVKSKAAFPSGGYYVPLPKPSVLQQKQQGQCGNWLQDGVINEIIQGDANVKLTSGASTIVIFMSTQCHVCHDIMPKLNQMYKRFRDRGLNMIGIHASPKGFRSSSDDIRDLKNFIAENKIQFPILDMHAKGGTQPLLPNGQPDYGAASGPATIRNSLYAKLFDDIEYNIPSGTILKHCGNLLEEPIAGYDLMGLDTLLEQYEDDLLWKKAEVRKDL